MNKQLKILTNIIVVLSLTPIVSADLLVHYKFDETSGTVAADASGNGFDGTVNGTTNWVTGTLGGALEFTGDSNVTLPAESIELFSDNGSVAFWMSADEPTGIYTMFWGGDNITGGGFGPENEMHVHLESAVGNVWLGGELSFFAIADPSVHLHSDPAKGVEPGNVPADPLLLGDTYWHHVAAVWSDVNSAIKMYVDGELISEAEYVSTAYPLTTIFLGQMGGGNRTFVGVLDDVRIYSHPLTDQDVLDLALNQTAVHEHPAAQPQQFVLHQNYPNPFNPGTEISFTLANADHVVLAVYNAVGQQVATLLNENKAAGTHRISFNAADLNSGLYFYELVSGGHREMRKMILMK